MKAKDLALRAREVQKASGLSHEELAERLDVTRSAVSHAVTWSEDPNLSGLRRRIIKELTGNEIEGPIWLENRTASE